MFKTTLLKATNAAGPPKIAFKNFKSWFWTCVFDYYDRTLMRVKTNKLCSELTNYLLLKKTSFFRKAKVSDFLFRLQIFLRVCFFSINYIKHIRIFTWRQSQVERFRVHDWIREVIMTFFDLNWLRIVSYGPDFIRGHDFFKPSKWKLRPREVF